MHRVNIRLVERLERPTLAEFRRSVARPRPMVISGAMDHWMALSTWTPTYLESKVGTIRVPVITAPEGQPEGRFVYGGKHGITKLEMRQCLGLLQGERPRIYMAGVPIATYLPSLAKDIALPDFVVPKKRAQGNLWISATNSKFPMHYDLDENIHALVAGRKRFLLFDYQQYPLLYPNSAFSSFPTHSRVDVDNPTDSHYPRFRQAQAYEVTLNPGEMIYMPAGCWHRVTTLEPSIAVNFWLGRNYLSHATLRILFPTVLRLLLGLGVAPFKALLNRWHTLRDPDTT